MLWIVFVFHVLMDIDYLDFMETEEEGILINACIHGITLLHTEMKLLVTISVLPDMLL